MTRAATLLLVTATLLSPGATSTPDLSQLSWMAGTWEAELEGLTMEEHWLAPRGGLMLGVHRDVRSSGAVLFEYLRIEQTPDGLAYFASPHGRAPTTFSLVSLEEQRAVFENPDHDFPQRIIYWREGDVLHARTEGDEAGEPRSIEWQWKLVRCGGDAVGRSRKPTMPVQAVAPPGDSS